MGKVPGSGRGRLVVLKGGLAEGPALQGPITRMGLHKRVQPIPNGLIIFVIAAKILLLASILYYRFG